MDVLKISTAGSVDDGKSTLIGRLLYDTNSLATDQLEAIEKSSQKMGYDYLDFSFATDGLVAEREQGITIDVAHIYFATDKRKFIIADSPGHVEYTRNMVTGASQSNLSIILIDARKGVIEQTYRHFFITNLLDIQKVVVCINKFDLVDYSEEIFNKIVSEFKALASKFSDSDQEIEFIPVSALKGDNVKYPSENMPWYKGSTLLDYLENVKSRKFVNDLPARFSVQYVIRPKKEQYHDYRGFAGKVKSGVYKKGDEVMVFPSQTTSKIKSIDKNYNTDVEVAYAGESVTLLLEDEVDVSRGTLISKVDEKPKVEKQITAKICWMQSKPLTAGQMFFLQHNTNKVKAKIIEVKEVYDTVNIEASSEADELKLNDIGEVIIKLSAPIFFDSFEDNKPNGSFILIDSVTNNTSGVGFIQ